MFFFCCCVTLLCCVMGANWWLPGATQAAWELQGGVSQAPTATASRLREQLRLQLDSSSDPCLTQRGVIDLPRWTEAADLPRLTCHDGDGLALECDGLPLRAEAALSTTSLSRRAPVLADGALLGGGLLCWVSLGPAF